MRKGQRLRYRPQPADFVDVYLLEGFNGARLHFRAHWRNVQQWVDDNGGQELVDRRIRHLEDGGKLATINRVLGQQRRSQRMMALAGRGCDGDMPKNGREGVASERSEILGG